MSHVDAGPKNDSDSEKKTEPAQDSSTGEMDVPKTKLFDAKAILWTFGKCLTALLPVYLAGYYRMSTSLVVFGMMVYAGWKHTREAKEARLKSAIELVSDEHEYISSKSFRSRRDLPSWVNFPDVEKVEWLNKVIQQAWPFIGQYLEKLLTETIAPSIRGSSTHLQTLCFTKVDFGGKPMKVVGVKAHTENEKGQILLDVYISYVGDVEINVEVKRYFCKAGVKGIQLHGMMRVILEPLIGDVPIVGAVTMFFIQRPKLTINWTGLTNLLDVPGLNVMSDTMIMDAIASFLVLPNRLTVPLVADLHVAQLRCPLPRGVVRIHLLEADGLASKDNYVKGVMVSMSDPYALLRVGPQTFKSRHLDNTLNPKWDEMYEVIAHEVPGQELEVEVFDKDPDHDDFLGRTKLDLGIVKKSKIVDEVRTLINIPVCVCVRACVKSNHINDKMIKELQCICWGVFVFKCICVCVQMKKGNKDPNPIVQISVQDVTRDSRICWNTVNPQWEDAFTFFIRDPSKQDICVQVKDNDRVQDLGSLSIPVSRLLSCQDLNLDEWFNLENSGPESPSPQISSSDDLRPLHTIPDPSFGAEGMLRLHLLEAEDLIAKDNMMGRMVKGKSDPYVKIHIGDAVFKSHVIKENLNPTWNEMYEVRSVISIPFFFFLFEVYDKDFESDDFLGRLVHLQPLLLIKYDDEWFTLNDIKHGRVHLVLEWLPTSTQRDRLDQVSFSSRHTDSNKSVPSAALLFIYLERAHDLPVSLYTSIHCIYVYSHLSYCHSEQISSAWDQPMGSLVLPIRELLSKPDLLMDQWLDLDGASPKSQILLGAQLKVRQLELSSLILIIFEHKMFSMGSGPVLSNMQTATTGQIKISLSFQKKLTVIIHACRGLVTSSKDSLDTYVSLILLPDKSKATKRKTSVKKKNLNPEFNERFEFDMSVEDAQRRELSVSVKNASSSFMNRDKDLIGQVIDTKDIYNVAKHFHFK
uniref:Extended synaptotagmin-1-like n=1 Tax=Sinocyclocheilus grahami TaxID=75366 RepID=A0A672MQK3_SINGR